MPFATPACGELTAVFVFVFVFVLVLVLLAPSRPMFTPPRDRCGTEVVRLHRTTFAGAVAATAHPSEVPPRACPVMLGDPQPSSLYRPPYTVLLIPSSLYSRPHIVVARAREALASL